MLLRGEFGFVTPEVAGLSLVATTADWCDPPDPLTFGGSSEEGSTTFASSAKFTPGNFTAATSGDARSESGFSLMFDDDFIRSMIAPTESERLGSVKELGVADVFRAMFLADSKPETTRIVSAFAFPSESADVGLLPSTPAGPIFEEPKSPRFPGIPSDLHLSAISVTLSRRRLACEAFPGHDRNDRFDEPGKIVDLEFQQAQSICQGDIVGSKDQSSSKSDQGFVLGLRRFSLASGSKIINESTDFERIIEPGCYSDRRMRPTESVDALDDPRTQAN